MTSSENEINWKELHAHPKLQNNLPQEIRDSWDRCRQNGIVPGLLKPSATNISGDLHIPHPANLIKAFRNISNFLLRFLIGNNVAMLFDKNSTVLDIIASKESFINKINCCGMGKGSIWNENLFGTNAASLGLALMKPIKVVGYEHYCRFAIDYACAFAPISAPIMHQREIIGGIGIVGPQENYQENTLGITMMAAMVLREKVTADRWNDIINESINEGVLAIDNQYRIVYINQNCCRILQIPTPETLFTPLSDVINRSKPENYYFWSTLEHSYVVEDEPIVVALGKDRIHCSVTIKPLVMPYSETSGKIIIIQESERINRIVKGYYGHGAQIKADDIIGNNPEFIEVKRYAMMAASSNSNILLIGESGTGKDIFAQAIHNESPKRNGPFLAINCAALPRELIASELFGYEDGAFTGARKGGSMGKFELADQGTIFLDEIGDMPLDLQATLLRVIEEKKVTRVGGNKPISINVRIIAATNKDIEYELARKTFRHDLYYRLGVIRINIPPLRERPDDVILLAKHFTKVLCRKLNKPGRVLAPEVLDAFLEYDWPGNVRELQNVLEGTIQLSSCSVITRDLFDHYFKPSTRIPQVKHEYNSQALEIPQKQMIISYLKKYDNNKSKTAKAMGISRKTLYKRIRDYDLDYVH